MNTKNQQGGFLQFIVLLLIVLFTMKYFDLSISEVVEWFKSTFSDVLR